MTAVEARRLVEAVSVRQQARARRRLERSLYRPLATWWTAQGRALRKNLAPYRGRFPLEEAASYRLVEAISDGEFAAAWQTTSDETSPLIAGVLDDHASRALTSGVAYAAAELGVELDFDLENPRAVAYMRQHGASLVTRIDSTTADQLRTLLTQAVDEGWSWQRTGREITNMFSGFSGRGPMGRHLRNRAELVAVTETAEAYAEGNALVRDRLAAAGVTVEKRWVTVGDNRVSAGCARNGAAGWIGHADTFPSGHPREPRFPGCRCVTTSRVVKETS